jgi:hypothetical protein
MREDPYWFKRSTSFLGIFLCWSRCQHAQDAWFAMSVTSTHAHDDRELLAIPVRLANSLDRPPVLPGYADFYFTEMQTFAYSPASGSTRITQIFDLSSEPVDSHGVVHLDIYPRVCGGVQNACFAQIARNTCFAGTPQNPPIWGGLEIPPFWGPDRVSKQ